MNPLTKPALALVAIGVGAGIAEVVMALLWGW